MEEHRIITEEMIGSIIEGCKGIVGQDLKSIIPYGSVARNEASSESDIDVALIVDGPMSDEKRMQLLNGELTWI